ncbi:hypothetical protein L195_g063371, partial [Trifolium pratense]
AVPHRYGKGQSGAVPHRYGKGKSGAPKLLAGFSPGSRWSGAERSRAVQSDRSRSRCC